MGKVPADAVFQHRGVVGFDPHANTMLAIGSSEYRSDAKVRMKANSQSRSSSQLTSVITRLHANLGPTLLVGLLNRQCRHGL
jgi:hypothetical protein